VALVLKQSENPIKGAVGEAMTEVPDKKSQLKAGMLKTSARPEGFQFSHLKDCERCE
jgi:hypothetical protein